ncbi:TPA: hypothetical protein EYP66_05530 [Candidatus Poribacteria bacterium]|nr:hypothetical protein [Candidatus Poribacteria bacterium]
MRKNFVVRIGLQELLIGLILGWFLLAQQASALRPPAGVLVLRPGGYAFADYPDAFDAFNKEGITIELWFYLTDIPSEWSERWFLIGKPGNYFIDIHGKNPFLPLINDPEGTIYVEYEVCSGCGGGSSTFQMPPGDSLLNRWVHVAYQIKGAGPVQNAEFFDGGILGTGETSSSCRFSLSVNPLFIGGKPGYNSLKGWIDEVRISRGWRYPVNKPINPPRRFQKDRNTLAIWHFDEGAWAPRYADASGNGYTLFASGTLPVNQEGKLTTMWGRLKMR